MSDRFREQKYQCTNGRCQAFDIVKLAENERTPPAINCWKCKGGQKVELSVMVTQGIGMFPVSKGE